MSVSLEARWSDAVEHPIRFGSHRVVLVLRHPSSLVEDRRAPQCIEVMTSGLLRGGVSHQVELAPDPVEDDAEEIVYRGQIELRPGPVLPKRVYFHHELRQPLVTASFVVVPPWPAVVCAAALVTTLVFAGKMALPILAALDFEGLGVLALGLAGGLVAVGLQSFMKSLAGLFLREQLPLLGVGYVVPNTLVAIALLVGGTLGLQHRTMLLRNRTEATVGLELGRPRPVELPPGESLALFSWQYEKPEERLRPRERFCVFGRGSASDCIVAERERASAKPGDIFCARRAWATASRLQPGRLEGATRAEGKREVEVEVDADSCEISEPVTAEVAALIVPEKTTSPAPADDDPPRYLVGREWPGTEAAVKELLHVVLRRPEHRRGGGAGELLRFENAAGGEPRRAWLPTGSPGDPEPVPVALPASARAFVVASVLGDGEQAQAELACERDRDGPVELAALEVDGHVLPLEIEMLGMGGRWRSHWRLRAHTQAISPWACVPEVGFPKDGSTRIQIVLPEVEALGRKAWRMRLPPSLTNATFVIAEAGEGFHRNVGILTCRSDRDAEAILGTLRFEGRSLGAVEAVELRGAVQEGTSSSESRWRPVREVGTQALAFGCWYPGTAVSASALARGKPTRLRAELGAGVVRVPKWQRTCVVDEASYWPIVPGCRRGPQCDPVPLEQIEDMHGRTSCTEVWACPCR